MFDRLSVAPLILLSMVCATATPNAALAQPQSNNVIPNGYVAHPVAPGKYALVISVEHYEYLPQVDNAVNDGLAITTALAKAGYGFVRFLPDPPTADSIVDRIDELIAQSRAAFEPGVITIFFAGHGYQTPNTNYIIPAGARKTSLNSDSLPVKTILLKISPSDFTLGIVFLDACRTVRVLDGTNTSAGLAANDAAGFGEQREFGSTVVGMAASANSAAFSIGNSNPKDSPYTDALSRVIPKKSHSLDQQLDEVRDLVKQDTNGFQVPTESKRSGTSRFFLLPGKTEDEAQDAAWALVMESGPRLKCLESYVNLYPGGPYMRAAEYLEGLMRTTATNNEPNCAIN